ncbi:MAG: hypothetical protein A2V70_11145 [Planctomycetes bacterium RBG_13_63_9]|nr:MAG: hypothetical protein A2V70_11145 [Planctomycetes bacterium RBG_13_63_9]
MKDAAIPQLLDVTRKREADSVKALLESLPRKKDKVFEHYVAELYRGNGWLSVVRGGRGDKSADILLYHPKNPDVVFCVVQCKNHARPLTFDDTRIELLKFEEKGVKEYDCSYFRIVTVNGFVKDAARLTEFNLELCDWSHVASLIHQYDPDFCAQPNIELYPHNQRTYDEIQQRWQQANRVAVVQPTGTGKSVLIARVMSMPEFAGNRTLVLAPSRPILGQLRSKLPWALSSTKFMTYARAKNLSDAEADAIAPKLIVLDEMHRCGAQEWGKGVHRLLDRHPHAPVLGTTATPIRYLDNCRDMASELFRGNVAGNVSLAQAIVRRILPMPNYICALYTVDEEVRELEGRIDQSRLDDSSKHQLEEQAVAARIDWERSAGAPKVLAKHVSDGLSKFMVFCKNKVHLDAMEEQVRSWFQKALKKPRVSYRVVSDDPDSTTNFARFRDASDPKKVHLLFCIDMLNEGVHIDDVSGVILLRPTESPIVFYQQIGRCIQVGLKHVPLIFDFVNNFRSIRATDFQVDLERANREERRRRADCGLPERPIAVSISDETRDFVRLLEAIEDRISPKELACRRTEQFCKRYRSLRNLPKQRSRNPEEAADAAWLSQMRHAKQGKGHRAFFAEMDEIAAKNSMGGLFDVLTPEQRKQRTLERTHRLCKRILSGDLAPKLKTWQNNAKRLKKLVLAGETVVGYYPEMEDIAASYGLSNVFDVVDYERVALERVTSLLNWMQENGRRPSKNRNDPVERAHFITVTQLRMAKQGRGKYQFLPEMEELASKAGFAGLFDDSKTRALKRATAFCQRYEGRSLPSILRRDPAEKKDAQWLVAQRMRKAGKGTGRHYPELDQIAKEFGRPRLFDTRPKVSFEDAQRWVRLYYTDHLDYPTQRNGAIPYAEQEGFESMTWATVFRKFAAEKLVGGVLRSLSVEDAQRWLQMYYAEHREYPTPKTGVVPYAEQHAPELMTWATVFRRFRRDKVLNSVRLAFTPSLVLGWNETEVREGRRALHKSDSGVVESAQEDGYPLSASAINARLKKEFRVTLAELLRPVPVSKEAFSIELAETILKDEYRLTGSYPTVISPIVEAAASYGYPNLSGNGLNKRLKKLGTTLKALKDRLGESRTQ